MKKKVLSILLAATFTVSMFAGCGNSNTTAKDDNAAKTEDTADDAAEEETKDDAATEDTASDGDFNITVNLASEPMTMDPALNSSVDGGIMALHLFEGLMKWEDSGEVANGTDGTADSGKLVPGQAESYEKTENDDGTVTYTFKLRDGIKWSDGKDVTAGDFEYSWILAAVVVLPTPPFPDVTTITSLISNPPDICSYCLSFASRSVCTCVGIAGCTCLSGKNLCFIFQSEVIVQNILCHQFGVC